MGGNPFTCTVTIMNRRRTLILSCVLLSLPSLGSAQGVATARVFQTWDFGHVADCQQSSPSSVSITSCPGTTWGGSYEASASAVGGVVRATSRATAANYDPGRLENLVVSANASWSEQAFLGGSGVRQLELTGRLTGTLFIGAQNAFSLANYVADALFGSERGHWQRSVNSSCAAGPARTCPHTESIDQHFTTRVTVDPAGYANFSASLGTQVFLAAIPGGPASGSVSADLGHTLVFTGYRVLDASGSDITAATPVTFTQGTTFVPSATVPEPGTWAMLGTGLLGLGAMSRRRRRAA